MVRLPECHEGRGHRVLLIRPQLDAAVGYLALCHIIHATYRRWWEGVLDDDDDDAAEAIVRRAGFGRVGRKRPAGAR